MSILLSKSFVLFAVAVAAGLLGRGWLSFVLAWALPGLGHWWLGERRRGVLAGGGVLGLFVCGVLIGGVDCVDQKEDGPWFLAQAWAGPVAYATDAANEWLLKTGRVGELLPSPGNPMPRPDGSRPPEPMVSSYKGLGTVNDVGTLFTALAGLMNLVVMLDAAHRARKAAEAELFGATA